MSIGFELDETPGHLGDYSWWDEKPDDQHEKALAAFKAIEARSKARLTDYRVFNRLYCNQDLIGFGPYDYYRRRTSERVTYNVIQAVIDTAASRITQNIPRTVFQTHGASLSLKRRAQNMQGWMDYQRRDTGLEDVSREVLVDSGTFGTGCWHITRSGKKIIVERVMAAELFVDQADALYGKPKQFFRRRFVDKGRLKEKYPDFADKIEALGGEDYHIGYGYGRDALVEQVEVIECWYLAGKKGRYSVCIEGATLESHPYRKPYPPFVFFNWKHRRQGFWGQGIAELLVGIQVELNKVLRKIQRSLHLMSTPQVWLSMQSAIKGQKITNQPGAINYYRDTPPVFMNPQGVHPQVFEYPDYLIQKAFHQVGVSTMAAMQDIPSGVTAAVAMREIEQIGNARFQNVLKRWETAHTEIAEQMLELGREIAAENDGHTVNIARDKHTIQEVDWKDVDLEDDQFIISTDQASSLPLEMGARKQYVTDIYDRGAITAQKFKKMLGWSDLEEDVAMDDAAQDIIDMMIEKMVEKGEYIPPEPWMDLDLGLKRAQLALMRYSTYDDVPYKNLEQLSKWLTQLSHMKAKAAMALAEPGAQAVPGTPPPVGPTGQQPMAVQPTDGTSI